MDPHSTVPPVSPVDSTASSVATHVMQGGSIATIAGWLTERNGIALIGLLVTIVGFAVNLYFQYRRDKRELEVHVETLAALRRENLFRKDQSKKSE